MKLSKNSWHYKLHKWAGMSDYKVPKSICPYFWLTVLTILASPIIALTKYSEAQRLGLTHDQALQSCEVERTTDRREFRHQTNRWRNH